MPVDKDLWPISIDSDAGADSLVYFDPRILRSGCIKDGVAFNFDGTIVVIAFEDLKMCVAEAQNIRDHEDNMTRDFRGVSSSNSGRHSPIIEGGHR